MPKKTQDGGAQSIVQYVLILLLIVAAFFIGFLWNKVQMMDSSGNGTNNPPTAQDPTPAPTAKFSFDPIMKELDIDMDEFDTCMDSDYPGAAVAADFETATPAGVRGTPASFLVDTSTGKIARIPGAVPLEQLTPVVDSMLSGEYVEEEEIDLADVTADEHIRGNQNARIFLVEYSDYDCPFCTRFHATGKAVVEQYSDQVAWVYRHFPLDSLHPNARAKAEASECVAKIKGNDAFWEYSDLLSQ